MRKVRCFAIFVLFAAWCLQAEAQPVPNGVCRPVSERTQEVGCWILTNDSVGELTGTETFWHLDTFPTRDAAEAAETQRSTVLEALGKIWLLTIDEAAWRASGGEHVTTIGRLPITPGVYATQYMEAIFNPGMTAPAHTHSGPEASYTVAGETCLETPSGTQVGRAGRPAGRHTGRIANASDATGTEVRRALVLILHDANKPATTLVHHEMDAKRVVQELIARRTRNGLLTKPERHGLTDIQSRGRTARVKGHLDVGPWPIASVRCREAIRSLSEQSGHQTSLRLQYPVYEHAP